jgi:hypothetical protein
LHSNLPWTCPWQCRSTSRSFSSQCRSVYRCS